MRHAALLAAVFTAALLAAPLRAADDASGRLGFGDAGPDMRILATPAELLLRVRLDSGGTPENAHTTR